MPNGFTVAARPLVIDKTCVGKFVLLNWKEYGWQIGKVTSIVTRSTPQLFKKYNVRIQWADGPGPANLDLKAYKSGSDVPLDSWVFLTPKAEEGQ